MSKPSLQEPFLPISPIPKINNNKKEKPEPKNKNVIIIFIYTFLSFSSRSIWNQSVLPAYIYLLPHGGAEKVGMLTAIMGFSQLLVSFPSGAIADKFRRDTTIRVSSFCGTIAIVFMIIAAYTKSTILLGIGLSIWGIFFGACNTCVNALLADSIPDGMRSKTFMQRTICINSGSLTGPIVAIVMFSKLGNVWGESECATVIIVGQILSLPTLLCLWFLNDDYTEIGPVIEDFIHEEEILHQLEGETCSTASTSDSITQIIDSSQIKNTRSRRIPFLIAFSDVLGGLAAGMSIRYFPIFFIKQLDLSPLQVQVIYLIRCFGLIVCSKIAHWGGKKLGRCQFSVLFKWTGISMMVLMLIAYNNGLSNYVVCTIYLLRTCFMNSTSPLTRSMLMDSVPKEERAKWSALESVTMFSWSGSAALGGFLVSAEGIEFNFYVTAGLQFLATIPLLFLFHEQSLVEVR